MIPYIPLFHYSASAIRTKAQVGFVVARCPVHRRGKRPSVQMPRGDPAGEYPRDASP